MNPICPLCGEEITTGQDTVQSEFNGAEVTAHRYHFETEDEIQVGGDFTHEAPVEAVEATKDESPSDPVEFDDRDHLDD